MNYERANHKWDEARDARLTEFWNSGLLLGEIAVRMQTTIGAIADRRHALGLPKRKETSVGWTEERVDLLKIRWREGRTAQDIAMELNCGLSRSAVIGKVNRLGLSKLGRAASAYLPRIGRSHVRPPKPGPQKKPALIHGDYAPSTEAMRIARAAEGRAANEKVAKGMGVESPNARPWMEDRRLGECNWPIGERGAVMSCCNPVLARGWCRGHLALGTAVAQPKAIRPRDASGFARFDRVEKDRPARAPVDRSVWDDARSEAA